MQILSYKTPERASPSKWRRRYLLYVPIVAGCFLVITFIPSLILGLVYMDVDPRSVPKSFDIFSMIAGFPLLDIWVPHSAFWPFVLEFVDALFWGFWIVALCHAISLVRSWIRSRKSNDV